MAVLEIEAPQEVIESLKPINLGTSSRLQVHMATAAVAKCPHYNYPLLLCSSSRLRLDSPSGLVMATQCSHHPFLTRQAGQLILLYCS